MGILGGKQIDVYGATGRERHHQAGIGRRVGTKTPLRSSIRAKLHTAEERAIYAWRKAITEPVHGLIKQARGFRQLLLRGSRRCLGNSPWWPYTTIS